MTVPQAPREYNLMASSAPLAFSTPQAQETADKDACTSLVERGDSHVACPQGCQLRKAMRGGMSETDTSGPERSHTRLERLFPRRCMMPIA